MADLKPPVPQPAPSAGWWLQRDEQLYGPYAAQTLRQILLEGRALPEDLVRQGAAGPWYRLGDVVASLSPVATPSEAPPPKKGGVPEDYETVAETVGMVPWLRARDNRVQGLVVAGGAVVGLIVGLMLGWHSDLGPLATALIGLLIGLVAATIISGFVLMILGLKRAVKRR